MARGVGARASGVLRHGRTKSILSFLIGLGLFLFAVWVLHRWARHVTLDELTRELEQITAGEIGLAVVYTFLSFVALAGYELYALRYVGRKLALWRIGLYSFIAQSLAHALGFAIFVGPTLRYKLYAAHGFTVLEVAKIQLFFMTTFGLGAATLAGGVLIIAPEPLAYASSFPEALWQAGGLLLLAGVSAILVWGALFHRPVRWFGQVLILPTARVTLIQIALGIADLCAVAAALHVLMPEELGLGYFEVLGIFVAAVTLGLVSHVPGSLGVFESAVLVLVHPDPEATVPLIGALVAFRAVYYMLPLACGAISLAALATKRAVAPARERAA